MNAIYLVTLMINDLVPSGGGEPYRIGVHLAFEDQPTAEDVMRAFDAEPALRKRQDYHQFRAAVLDGINTFGVPRLNAHRMTDTEGQHLAVPRVVARWSMNIVGKENAESDIEYGSITVSLRPINEVAVVKEVPLVAKARQKRKTLS